MAKAHILTYQSIHQIRKERGFSGQTMVGVANHLRIFDRKKGDFLAKIPIKLVDYIFHDIFMEAMIYGKFKFPIGFGDRKSTRLNSSHVAISYAVFCLKKKI